MVWSKSYGHGRIKLPIDDVCKLQNLESLKSLKLTKKSLSNWQDNKNFSKYAKEFFLTKNLSKFLEDFEDCKRDVYKGPFHM